MIDSPCQFKFEGSPCGLGRASWDRDDLVRQLREARAAAEAATEAKSVFLANISHEIRTPLNGMIAVSQLLLQTALSPEQRELVATLEESGTALLSILGDVLEFSCIASDDVKLRLEPTWVRDTVEACLQAAAPESWRRKISLSYRLHPTLACNQVITDPVRLRQVLTSLVHNAVKFNVDGGEVEVEACVAVGSGKLVVSVRDTGIGMSGDAMKEIFAVFTQGEGSLNRRHGGTGLGLTIADKLVRSMNGTIAVEPAPRESGCIFTVTLPLMYASKPKKATEEGRDKIEELNVEPGTPTEIAQRCIDDSGSGLALSSISEDTTDSSGADDGRCAPPATADFFMSSLYTGATKEDALQATVLSRSEQYNGHRHGDRHGENRENGGATSSLKGRSVLVDVSHPATAAQISDSCESFGMIVHFKNEQGVQDLCITTPDRVLMQLRSPSILKGRPIVVIGNKRDLPFGTHPNVIVIPVPVKHSRLLAVLQRAIGPRVAALEAPLYDPERPETSFDNLHLHIPADASSVHHSISDTNPSSHHCLPSRPNSRRSVDNSALERRLVLSLSSAALLQRDTWQPSLDPLRSESPTATSHSLIISDHDEQQQQAQQRQETEKGDEACKQLPPFRILVAEDNPINIRVVTRVLNHVIPTAGVDVAVNGLEVVEAAMAQQYGLILMDIHMPEMDGLEAARTLLENMDASQVPTIVALSADTLQPTREKCVAAGIIDFVSKPFRVEDVERVVDMAKRKYETG